MTGLVLLSAWCIEQSNAFSTKTVCRLSSAKAVLNLSRRKQIVTSVYGESRSQLVSAQAVAICLAKAIGNMSRRKPSATFYSVKAAPLSLKKVRAWATKTQQDEQ